MIYLAAKAPGDDVDYNVSMADFIPAGFSIDTLTMEITGAGNGESPIELSVHDFVSQPLAVGDADNRAILFWLMGGTPGVRYRGEITMSDDESSGDTDRVYVRQFEVEVANL